MTTISTKIIADSISPEGKRLTTMQLRYPRWIHAELMTHRSMSRNASSSRAIPVERLIQDVLDDPAVPMFWGKNQKGMQAGEECNSEVLVKLYGENDIYLYDEYGQYHPTYNLIEESLSNVEAWLRARDSAVMFARAFSEAGYHKQIVNRLLEPFSHINVVVTATEWSNFFALRRHNDAEPHIHLLADRMYEAMEASTATLLEYGEWHMPYITPDDWHLYPPYLVHGMDGYSLEEAQTELLKLSVARCARVSYMTHDGKKPNIADDLLLYERLVGSVPLHASPTEHQGTPRGGTSGNFVGWLQYRKTLPGECQ